VIALALVAAALVAVLAAHAPRRAVAARRPGPTRQRTRWARLVPARRVGPPDEPTVAAWCDDVARRVRAGASLTGAVEADPRDERIAQVLDPVRLALRRGASLADSARTAARAADGGAWSLALGAVHAAAVLGGPGAAALEQTAAVLRARHADQAERRVHAAQARMSTLVLTVLPIASLVVAVAGSAAVRDAVVSATGAACVTAGLALELAGWWWSRRILDGRGPA
jgi:tight adherence protein B